MDFRPLTEADAEAVLEARLESLDSLRRFLPPDVLPLTVEAQRERLGSGGRFGLFEEGRLLASGSLHPRAPLNPRGTEIGFWVRSSSQGKGLATLITRLLVVHAVEELGMDRVQIAHSPENGASQRVIEKCGFVLEGRLRNAVPPYGEVSRDLLLYSLLPEEARAQEWYGGVLEKCPWDDNRS